AGILGSTTIARTTAFPTQDVIQLGGASELGVERPGHYRIALEGGYASGDSNPIDGSQRRFTFHPDHRIGLILFPELIAWQTARSATIAQDPSLMGTPARGARLLPTNGGVAGASYLNPTAQLFFFESRLDLRFGVVVATANTD